MSKLLDTTLHVTPQTQCPGNVAYMSPEALRTPPVCNRKLDCFSFGVLTIQIMTRLFPDPGPARQVVEDLRFAAGEIEVPVVDRERRKEHIDLITPNHPLLTTAMKCLEYHESNRPSAQELCDQLAILREDPQYTQSVHQAQERGSGGASATADLAAKDQQIAELQRSLAAHEADNQDLQRQLQEKEEALTAEQEQNQRLQCENQLQLQDKSRIIDEQDRQLQEKSRVIDEREGQLRELNNQLQTQEQATAEFQQNLLHKERRIRELEECFSAKDTSQQGPREHPRSAQLQERPPVNKTPVVQWKQNRPMPVSTCNLGRDTGDATADGTVVYVQQRQQVYAYHSDEDSWANLPDCPNIASSLMVVKGLLTAVGGVREGNYTNILVSLTGEGNQRKWSEHFLPMLTKRSKPAVAYRGRSLVVAGGYSGWKKLSTIEVMDTDVLQWFVATSLPHPFIDGTLTICGDNLYLLGGVDHKGQTKSVLTCSLTALLQSCRPQSLGRQLQKFLTLEDTSVWRRVADLLWYWSTGTTVCGQLVAIGGYDSGRYCGAIYTYNPINNIISGALLVTCQKLSAGSWLCPCLGTKLWCAVTPIPTPDPSYTVSQ